MRTSIRTHLAAAALLLAPVAATLVAEPVAAQQRAVVAQPAIRGLTLNSNAGLAPGAVLRLQVEGAAGARATTVALGSSGVRVALREQGAGRYVGQYTIRRNDRIDPTQTLAVRASLGGRAVAQNFSYPAAFQALALGATHGADRTPPQIADVSPSAGSRTGERGRTTVFARLSDDRSGVDAGSVRLVVDGLDVTPDARITRNDVVYRERLGRGRHHAELLVRDRAGNVARNSWSFVVS
jgi:hypothetical protein